MIIMIILIAISVVATISYFFSESFRGFLDAIFYGVANLWEDHRALFIWIALAIWIIPTIILLATGWYANAMPSMIVFMIFFPILILMSIGKGLRSIRTLASASATSTPTLRSSGGFMRFAVIAILTIAAFNIAVGIYSPAMKGSWDRWSSARKGWFASWLNDDAARTEGSSGKIGVTTERKMVYDQNGKDLFYVPKGTKLRLASEYKAGKVTNGSEGMVWVMIANKSGEFVRGGVGMMVDRKIDWNYQENYSQTVNGDKTEQKPSVPAPVPETVVTTPPPQPQVTSNGPGKNPVEFFYDTASLRRAGMEKVATLEPGRYRFTMTGGGEFQNGQCTPRFTSQKCGEIFIFAGDQFAFPGDQLNLESQEHLFVKINSHERSGRTGTVKIRIEKIG